MSASSKAERLLRRYLTAEQAQSLTEVGGFVIQGKSGLWYLLGRGLISRGLIVIYQYQPNVGLWQPLLGKICLDLESCYSVYDLMLVEKLLLETDERRVYKIGTLNGIGRNFLEKWKLLD